MYKTGKVLTTLAVCICAVVATGLVVAKISIADEQMDMAKKCMMDKGPMKCAKVCQKNMADISSAMTALDAAIKAIDAGDTAGAKTEIGKAQSTLAGMKESIEKCMQQMPVVNDNCPISGKPVDRMNTPANLTVMYKGMKVGFCCSNCPPAWEKLTDAEKDTKLEKVLHKDSEEKMMHKGGEMMQKTEKKASGYE